MQVLGETPRTSSYPHAHQPDHVEAADLVLEMLLLLFPGPRCQTPRVAPVVEVLAGVVVVKSVVPTSFCLVRLALELALLNLNVPRLLHEVVSRRSPKIPLGTTNLGIICAPSVGCRKP